MAFFKFRFPGSKPSEDVVQSAPPAESVEVVRRRARHRLIGASLLVLAAVIGFPMLFDSQPRPVPVNIPIVVPDRQTAPPLSLPAAKAEKADKADPADQPAKGENSTVAVADALDPKEQVVAAAGTAVAAATGAVAAKSAIKKIATDASTAPDDSAAKAAAQKAQDDAKRAAEEKAKADAKRAAEEKAKAKAKAEADAKAKAAQLQKDKEKEKQREAAKAKAALEGDKPPPTDAAPKADKPTLPAEGRFIVQAGTFQDVAKARAARLKIEAAGIKTYTQVIKSADGQQHIRVRVGPYPTKAEADKAASKLKGLKLEAGIYQL